MWTVDITITRITKDGIVWKTETNIVFGCFVMFQHMFLLIARAAHLWITHKECHFHVSVDRKWLTKWQSSWRHAQFSSVFWQSLHGGWRFSAVWSSWSRIFWFHNERLDERRITIFPFEKHFFTYTPTIILNSFIGSFFVTCRLRHSYSLTKRLLKKCSIKLVMLYFLYTRTPRCIDYVSMMKDTATQ